MEAQNATTIENIAALAAQVGGEYDEQQAAIVAERDAEAEVLAAAIDAARPALKAICSQVKVSHRSTNGRNGCHPVHRYGCHAQDGLVLMDGYDQDGDSSSNRGSYSGDRLVLLVDGTLAVFERTGTWSHWQSEWSQWEATVRPIAVREAMDTYDLDPCLTAISEALAGQIGKRDAKAARERAERLAAMARLAW